MKASLKSLTKFEIILWVCSCIFIVFSFLTSGNITLLSTFNLISSFCGVCALIFVAKGDPLGQILTVVFSILYAITSYGQRYYGEMITYLGMTAPMAIAATVSWIRNPYKRGKAEVRIAKLSKRQIIFLFSAATVVTMFFSFILNILGNASMFFSTVSITTSFFASYLTFCRSPFYALAYAANDAILIVLWIIASANDPSSLSMVACFIAFFVNDLYGYYSWRKIQREQDEAKHE